MAGVDEGTNVRARIPRPLGWMGWVAGRVAPRWTAERLVEGMLRTRRRTPSDEDEAFRASCDRISVEVDGGRAFAYASGPAGAPAVVMLHGWDGSAADFRHIAPAVVAGGFRAVAIDGPGHGASDGYRSNALLLARAMTEVIGVVGPPAAIVAHSFGAAAAGYALANGLPTERLVLLAPAPDPSAYVRAFASVGGDRLTREALGAMSRRLGVDATSVALRFTAPRITLPVTVVHDRGDREVPLGMVERVVERWPSATLLRTDGLGHRRLLRDRAVVDLVVRAVQGENERSCIHGSFVHACAQCTFERELFDRRLRWA